MRGRDVGKARRQRGGALVTAKEATQAAAAVAGGAAAAFVHPSTPGAVALAAALLALFPPVVAIMTEATARRLRARNDRFIKTVTDEWARDENKTPDEVAGLLESRASDPDFCDAIWRAVRAVMEAPNPAAAVPLGVLTAEYGRGQRPVDAFFRGTVRLLTELSEQETADLRKLLAWALGSCRRSPFTILASDIRESATAGRAGVRVPWVVKIRRDDSTAPAEADSANDAWVSFDESPPDAGRLFAVLKASGLGSEPSMGVFGAAILVELDRAATERLVRALRVSDAH